MQPGAVLRDDVVTGLEVRAFANGSSSYYLWFRTKLGKARHPKLGGTDLFTLAEARKAARDMLLKVANGADPIADRAGVRGEPTMRDLWTKWRELKGQDKKTADQDMRVWLKIIEPKHGDKRVRSFSYEDADAMHRSLGATPYMANRVLQLYSAMFTFAERPLKWRDQHTNPCRGIEHYPEIARRRFANKAELPRIEAALQAELAHAATMKRASYRQAPQFVAFLYLLLYTGARPGEIEMAQRSWLEPLPDGGGVFRLPDSKTGQRNLYLPPQAMQIMAGLPQFADGTICGCKQPVHTWRRIRKAAGCPDLRMYPDLRRSFATVAMGPGGQAMSVVGGLLGHKTTQTTMIYARLMEETASAAVGSAGNKMAELMGGGQ